MNKKYIKMGIVGLGFVGKAVEHYFKSEKKLFLDIYRYDIYKKIGSLEEVNRAGIVFVCVPTPYHPVRGFDLSAVEEVVAGLTGKKIIVIKSTVVPGTTETLQKKYPGHKFLFNPEFLRAKSAAEDFASPDRQIIGYTRASKSSAGKILRLLPKAPFSKIMDSREAEVIKYMGNAFLAMKVVFANEFYELCRTLGLSYDQVRLAVGEDIRIGRSHLNVAQDGYRGYGGGCFPKDVNALLEFADKKKVKMELLKAVRKVNRRLLAGSGTSEKAFL